jgi:ferredoxin
MASTNGPVALAVDRIRCDGYGMCAELLPEMIELDDWGYPILRPGPVPPDLLTLARRAVDVCPVLAIRLAAVGAQRSPTLGPAASPAREHVQLARSVAGGSMG